MSAASLRRAAIVLASLSRPAADRLLLQMSTDQARRVRQMMRQLGEVDPAERQRAIDAFVRRQRLPSVDPLAPAAPGDAPGPLPSGMADPSTPPASPPASRAASEGLQTASDPPQPGARLPFLDAVPDAVLLRAVADEHPQTVALVLAALPAPQAGRLLGSLPAECRGDVVRRLARMEEIPPDALEHVGEHLRGLMAEVAEPPASAMGSRTLAAILDHLEPARRKAVFEEVRREVPEIGKLVTGGTAGPTAEDAPATAPGVPPSDRAPRATREPRDEADRSAGPDLPLEEPHHTADSADPVDRAGIPSLAPPRAPGISFDELQQLPVEALRAALAEVDSEIAVVALCGARPSVTEMLLASLPRRQSKLVRRRLQAPGPLPLSDIDLAQRVVAEAASRLDDEGRLPKFTSAALAAA